MAADPNSADSAADLALLAPRVVSRLAARRAVRKLVLLVPLLAASMLQVACGSKGERPIIIASVGDVSSLDPHLLDVNHPTGSVIWSLFDSLVRRGPDGADLPRLAQSWERRDDLTWRFHLRHDVKFQDGSPFSAADVKFSFDRMNQPPFNALQQLWPQTTLKQVRVVDDYTIDLMTEKPSVTMLYWLEEAFVAPKAYYSSHDEAYLNTHPLGSGPYRFKEWVPGDHVALSANPTYFNGPPPLKEVVFKVVPDLSARLNGLATGDIDLALELTPDTFAQATTAHSRGVEVLGLRKLHFGISQHSSLAALKDVRVRQALNYAIDVPTMIKTLMHGSTTPLTSVVNPPNADPALVPYGYHPDRARELLAAAGYPNGFDLDIEFTPMWGQDKDVSETVAGYLQAIGIRPHLHADEWSDFRRKLSDASFNGIFYAGWAALINPPVELVIFTCHHEDNASGYCDPKYDELVHAASNEYDPAKRQLLIAAAQKITWEQAFWIFLWRAPVYAGMSNRLDYSLRPDDYVEIYLAKPRT
jgi:peptide/nickel transport system substrate-binding protein